MLKKWNSPSQVIREGWPLFSKIPAGSKIFSKLVGKFIPYTGSVDPLVQNIESGTATVLLRDKKKVRNHLNSIHAIAIANVGEFCTGLSLISQLRPGDQAILVKLEVAYLKKARGDITANAQCTYAPVSHDTEFPVTAYLQDSEGNEVATVTGHWRVRPQQVEGASP